MTDLSHSFDPSKCFCLNERTKDMYKHVFTGDNTLYLESDADEQVGFLCLSLSLSLCLSLFSLF